MAKINPRYVSTFRAPTEYERQIEEARRRAALAEALAQQEYQPMEGAAAPIPAAAPLVKALQGYMTARAGRQAQEAKTVAEKAGRTEAVDYMRSFDPEQRTVGVGDIAAMEASRPYLEGGQLRYDPASVVAAPNQRLMPAMTPTGEIDVSQPMQMQVGGPLSIAQKRARALEGFESSNPLVQQFALSQYEATTPKTTNLKVGDIDPSKFTSASIAAATRANDISKLVPVEKPDESKIGKPSPSDFTPASIAKFAASGNYADLVPITKPAAVTNINLGGRGSEVAQKLYLEKIDALSGPAKNATRILTQVNAMDEATRKGTYTGSLAPTAVGATQFLNSFGFQVDPSVLANTREFQAASSQLVLQFMASLGGARGFTDKETAILQDAFPKIVDSPEARKQIADLLRDRAVQDVEDYNDAVDVFSRTYKDTISPYEKIDNEELRYLRWKRSQGGR